MYSKTSCSSTSNAKLELEWSEDSMPAGEVVWSTFVEQVRACLFLV